MTAITEVDDKPCDQAAKSASCEHSSKTLDDVFKSIGQFGPYQRRVVFLLALVSFSTAFNNLGYVFWAARPSFHYCLPSPDDQQRLQLLNMTSLLYGDDDVATEVWLNLTVPWITSSSREATRSGCVEILNLFNHYLTF